MELFSEWSGIVNQNYVSEPDEKVVDILKRMGYKNLEQAQQNLKAVYGRLIHTMIDYPPEQIDAMVDFYSCCTDTTPYERVRRLCSAAPRWGVWSKDNLDESGQTKNFIDDKTEFWIQYYKQ